MYRVYVVYTQVEGGVTSTREATAPSPSPGHRCSNQLQTNTRYIDFFNCPRQRHPPVFLLSRSIAISLAHPTQTLNGTNAFQNSIVKERFGQSHKNISTQCFWNGKTPRKKNFLPCIAQATMLKQAATTQRIRSSTIASHTGLVV